MSYIETTDAQFENNADIATVPAVAESSITDVMAQSFGDDEPITQPDAQPDAQPKGKGKGKGKAKAQPVPEETQESKTYNRVMEYMDGHDAQTARLADLEASLDALNALPEVAKAMIADSIKAQWDEAEERRAWLRNHPAPLWMDYGVARDELAKRIEAKAEKIAEIKAQAKAQIEEINKAIDKDEARQAEIQAIMADIEAKADMEAKKAQVKAKAKKTNAKSAPKEDE